MPGESVHACGGSNACRPARGSRSRFVVRGGGGNAAGAGSAGTFTTSTAPDAVLFRSPQIDDGVRLWEIARDSKVLDLNSSYAYLLWCRDFSATSIVAEVDGRVVGFVSGYTRPSAQETLFVWQVAVDEDQRGLGVGKRLMAAAERIEAKWGLTATKWLRVFKPFTK